MVSSANKFQPKKTVTSLDSKAIERNIIGVNLKSEISITGAVMFNDLPTLANENMTIFLSYSTLQRRLEKNRNWRIARCQILK